MSQPLKPLPLAPPPPPAADLAEALKAAARRLGFDLVGIAPPGAWATGEAFEPWLAAGYEGEMAYMRKDAPVRPDPRRRFPWAKAALLVGLSYRTKNAAPPADRRHFSKYAWGDDYHGLMARKLALLKAEALALGGGLDAHYDVDTGPFLERAAAAAAGLGWIAKNTMLIHERAGSYFFLGSVLVPYELPPDRAAPGRCGTCERCLDACPTRAFVAPYLLDARRCISYLTIELEGPIPRELRPLIGELVFGCDICQEVCPWVERAERKEPPLDHDAFRARPGLASERLEALLDLLALDDEGFRVKFRNSPVKRTRRRGLARNVCVALGNRGDPAALPALAKAAAADPEAVVRGHAAWAIGEVAARWGDIPRIARAALEALQTAARDAEASVREEAEAALGRVRVS